MHPQGQWERGHGAGEEVGKAGGRCQAGEEERGEDGEGSQGGEAKPIELYYWPTPNGFKISIMLEECKLPYTMIPVNISKGEQFNPDFLKISPNNRMPAIIDPDGPGGRPISMFESGAILQYLGRKTGKFYPSEERGARRGRAVAVLADGRASARWRGRCTTSRTTRARQLTYAISRYVDEVNRLYGVMNIRLKDRDFIAGKYSIADMALVGWVNGWPRQGQNIDEFPNLKAWLETREGAPGGAEGHVARPRAAARHRHEGSEGAAGAVRATRARELTRCAGKAASRAGAMARWLVRAEGTRLAIRHRGATKCVL